MATQPKEGGKGRPLNRFVEIDGKLTKRPSSHTDRADILGLETRRHPLRGRGHTVGDYHLGSEMVPVDDAQLRIRLPQPRPGLKAYQSIAEGEVLGANPESHDIFVAEEDIEGDPVDTQVTGAVPGVLFRNEIGDAITPMVAKSLDDAGLLNLDLADSEDSF